LESNYNSVDLEFKLVRKFLDRFSRLNFADDKIVVAFETSNWFNSNVRF